jgi:23S rRNA (guanine745-N1)-methyltransferase
MTTLLCTVRGCATPLARDERRLVCERGHTFDVSRSGYLNLLQPQDRRSRVPGDTPEAVQARRRFLDRGHTEPLVRALVAMLPLANGASLVDAGCGEGHHLAAFRRAYDIDAHGIDISVAAIELAARRWRDCTWIVANADRFLPYADGSLDAVTSITARLNAPEFRRVLRDDGTLLVALPAPDDVIELREAILGERVERDRVERTVEMFAAHFSLVKHERLRHVARLDHDAIVDVMTSAYRGLRTKERERLREVGEMEVTLSRDVLLFAPLTPTLSPPERGEGEKSVTRT